jgi:hypothetical protein
MSMFGEVPKLNLKQKIVLALEGYVFIKYMKPVGYLDFTPVYVVRCKRHGLFLDIIRGFNLHFDCDECIKDRQRQKNRRLVS